MIKYFIINRFIILLGIALVYYLNTLSLGCFGGRKIVDNNFEQTKHKGLTPCYVCGLPGTSFDYGHASGRVMESFVLCKKHYVSSQSHLALKSPDVVFPFIGLFSFLIPIGVLTLMLFGVKSETIIFISITGKLHNDDNIENIVLDDENKVLENVLKYPILIGFFVSWLYSC